MLHFGLQMSVTCLIQTTYCSLCKALEAQWCFAPYGFSHIITLWLIVSLQKCRQSVAQRLLVVEALTIKKA